MPRTVDEREFGELQRVLAGLIGVSLEEAYWSYPDELVLVFADARQAGRWTLETVTSAWVLLGPAGLAARRGDKREAIDQAFRHLVGIVVTAVSIRQEDLALSLILDGQAAWAILTARPRWIPRGTPPLWQLGTPGGQEILAQRNGLIDIVPSNVPLDELVRSGLLRV